MRAPLLIIPHTNHSLPNIQFDFFPFALRTTAALWARCLLCPSLHQRQKRRREICVCCYFIELKRERGKGEGWEWEWLIARVYWGRHIVTSNAVGRALRNPTGKPKRHQQQETESPILPNGNHTANRNNVYTGIIARKHECGLCRQYASRVSFFLYDDEWVWYIQRWFHGSVFSLLCYSITDMKKIKETYLMSWFSVSKFKSNFVFLWNNTEKLNIRINGNRWWSDWSFVRWLHL